MGYGGIIALAFCVALRTDTEQTDLDGNDEDVIQVYLAPYTPILPFSLQSNTPCGVADTDECISGWTRINAIGRQLRENSCHQREVLSIFNIDVASGFFNDASESQSEIIRNAAADVFAVDNISLFRSADEDALHFLNSLNEDSTPTLLFDSYEASIVVAGAGRFFTYHSKSGRKFLVFTALSKYARATGFLEEAVRPIVSFFAPDFVVVRVHHRGGECNDWLIDDPLVHVCVLLSRYTANTTRQGNHTTTVYFNPFLNDAVVIEWGMKQRRVRRFHSYFLQDSEMAPFHETLMKERTADGLGLVEAAVSQPDPVIAFSHTGVDYSNDKRSFCTTMECRLGNFFADALFSLAVTFKDSQSIDFAMIGGHSLLRGWHKGDVYRHQLLGAYRASGRLFFVSMWGAQVWFCVEESLRYDIVHDNRPVAMRFLQVSKHIRYEFQRVSTAPWVKLLSIEVYRPSKGSWQSVNRDNIYRFITTEEVARFLPPGSFLESQTIDISLQQAVLNYVQMQRGVLNILLEGRIRDRTNSTKRVLWPAMSIHSQASCAVNSRWVQRSRVCERCPFGFHQPLPGQDHCVQRSTYSIQNGGNIAILVSALLLVFLTIFLANFVRIFVLGCAQRRKTLHYGETLKRVLGEIIEKRDFTHSSDFTEHSAFTSASAIVDFLRESGRYRLPRGPSNFVDSGTKLDIPELYTDIDFVAPIIAEQRKSFKEAYLFWIFSSASKTSIPDGPFEDNAFFNQLVLFQQIAVKIIEWCDVKIVSLEPTSAFFLVHNTDFSGDEDDSSRCCGLSDRLMRIARRSIPTCLIQVVFCPAGIILKDKVMATDKLLALNTTVQNIFRLLLESSAFEASFIWKIHSLVERSKTEKFFNVRFENLLRTIHLEHSSAYTYSFDVEDIHSRKVIQFYSIKPKKRKGVAVKRSATAEGEKNNKSLSNGFGPEPIPTDTGASAPIDRFSTSHINILQSFETFTIMDRESLCWTVSKKLLGKGNFAEVYLGMCPQGKLVAVKMIDPHRAAQLASTDSPRVEITERLLREMFLLRDLRHQHIVGYLTSFALHRKLVLVTEFVSGGSLQQFMQNFSPLKLLVVKKYLEQCLSALSFLHERKIVHGDIKPQNILVDSSGACKLADFGSSMMIHEIVSREDIVGTPFYMAPEACRGVIDQASDIWSIGILAYFLLTNSLPFESTDGNIESSHGFVYRLGYDESYGPQISEATVGSESFSFLLSILRRDPRRRPTAEELLKLDYFRDGK